MKLLNEIIELSTSADAPLSVVLRKLLVLSYDLKNARLTTWANAELDGYDSGQDLPDYRIVRTGARGTFTGSFGAGVKNQPLPASILDKEHRHWATQAGVRQNIASIEATAKAGGGRIPWPADLVLLYQGSFIQGYALADAWQDMPGAVLVGIIDTVRNRALRFALELRSELGQVGDDLSAVPPSKVDQTVTNYIYGGNVVIGGTSHRFSQTGIQNVIGGDQVGLATALGSLGFTGTEIAECLEAIHQDNAEGKPTRIGQRAVTWLSKIGAGVGKAGLSVTTDVAKAEARKLILGYLGLT